QLRQKYPHSHASGGISNVSFSFRGNKTVREAMHAAFLYHAIKAGLTMGIVNAGQLAIYEEIPKDLLELVEDVLLNRRADGTERLLVYADSVKGQTQQTEKQAAAWRSGSLEERLSHALVQGIVDHLDDDLAEARTKYPTALSIIEGPRMDGMNIVGNRFGSGKMFLPQGVTRAREMERRQIRKPLLIGGATTSKLHTAVKIAPRYSRATVHVLDASRAVGVVSSLLSSEKRDAFVSKTRSEYERLRENQQTKSIKLLSIDEARARRAKLEFTPAKPDRLGVQVFEDVPLENIEP